MANIQLYPTDKLYFPNDILSKRLFNLTEDDYFKAIKDRDGVDVVEKKNHSKFGNIISPFRIRVDDKTNFTVSEPLDQFDFAVLCSCISEWRADNRHTTPSIIYRALTGKFGDYDANPSKNQLANILQSVDKLMRTQIAINMDDVCENFKYNGGKNFTLVSALLPCKRVTETTVNGNKATVIHLLEKSPLLEIAEMKNGQLISCDSQILNVLNQNNTRMNIAIKTYVLRRVLEILAHRKQMVPTITFADVFEKCRLTNANRMTKSKARGPCTNFFKHLQDKKIIKSFRLNKKGVYPYSISLNG